MPVLMIFIDGLGLGSDDPGTNPLSNVEAPFIRGLLREPLTLTGVGSGIVKPGIVIKGIDATLGVSGIPQSATGQTALFTGINAARTIGRHVNGFPTKALRNILESWSIFKVINHSGLKAVFANTFTTEYFESSRRGRWRHSASTTAALAGGCRLLMVEDLLKGEAIYQDITNEQLILRNYPVGLLTPELAAANLAGLSGKCDFTLFEYFQTDRCGHAKDQDLAMVLLERLDRLLAAVVAKIPSGLTLVITSDHGNIEDLSIKTHTFNPVPLIVLGPGAGEFAAALSLTDIYPAILRVLGITF